MVYYEPSVQAWYCGICNQPYGSEIDALSCEQNDDNVPYEEEL